MKKLLYTFIIIFLCLVIKFYGGIIDQTQGGSENNLGVAYEYGTGVSQDYAKTIELYEETAGKGSMEAQYNLGVMYENSQGTIENKVMAKKYFKQACESHYQSACNLYAKLNEQGVP